MKVEAIKFKQGKKLQIKYLGEIKEFDEGRILLEDFYKLKAKIALPCRNGEYVKFLLGGKEMPSWFDPGADYYKYKEV